jgi:hypothetical protein
MNIACTVSTGTDVTARGIRWAARLLASAKITRLSGEEGDGVREPLGQCLVLLPGI